MWSKRKGCQLFISLFASILWPFSYKKVLFCINFCTNGMKFIRYNCVFLNLLIILSYIFFYFHSFLCQLQFGAERFPYNNKEKKNKKKLLYNSMCRALLYIVVYIYIDQILIIIFQHTLNGRKTFQLCKHQL